MGRLRGRTVRRSTSILDPFESGALSILSDFTGASFDAEAIRVLQETAAFDQPFVKKSAFVGTGNFPPGLAENLKSFSRREFPAFKTRDEALAVGEALNRRALVKK